MSKHMGGHFLSSLELFELPSFPAYLTHDNLTLFPFAGPWIGEQLESHLHQELMFDIQVAVWLSFVFDVILGSNKFFQIFFVICS